MVQKRKDWTWGEFVKNDILPEFPDFKIKFKGQSKLMKFWSWCLFLLTFGQASRKDYMERYSTTVGQTVYVPDSWRDRKDHWNAINTLVHERQHMRQGRRLGLFRHTLAYIFWPLPIGLANYRLDAEVEATAIAAVYDMQVYDFPLSPEAYERHARIFTSSMYFWPTFSKKNVKRELAKKVAAFTSIRSWDSHR